MSGDEPVGGIGAETAKLFEALHEWSRTTFAAGGPLGPERIATGAPECAWCPICQLIGVLRGERPELTDKISEAGSALVTAVRALLDSGANPHFPHAKPAPHRNVQHIDLGDG
jgi:hypothetical protein